MVYNLTEDPPMTDEMLNLRALIEKSPDADLLREIIGFAAQITFSLSAAGVVDKDGGPKYRKTAKRGTVTRRRRLAVAGS
jgi:hypothetical protein